MTAIFSFDIFPPRRFLTEIAPADRLTLHTCIGYRTQHAVGNSQEPRPQRIERRRGLGPTASDISGVAASRI
jgi:hypothetical protein